MIFLHAQQFATLLGLLTIVPTGHGAVYFNINNLVIYVDPYSVSTDYSGYPKATFFSTMIIMIITTKSPKHL
jgi:hypothetical protein